MGQVALGRYSVTYLTNLSLDPLPEPYTSWQGLITIGSSLPSLLLDTNALSAAAGAGARPTAAA